MGDFDTFLAIVKGFCMVLSLREDSTDLKFKFTFLFELPHTRSYSVFFVELGMADHFEALLQINETLFKHSQPMSDD